MTHYVKLQLYLFMLQKLMKITEETEEDIIKKTLIELGAEKST